MEKERIKERLEMLPSLYSTDGMRQREVQIVIYHMFSRWTWYVVEGEPKSGRERGLGWFWDTKNARTYNYIADHSCTL